MTEITIGADISKDHPYRRRRAWIAGGLHQKCIEAGGRASYTLLRQDTDPGQPFLIR